MKKTTLILTGFLLFGMISFAQVTPFTLSGKVTNLQSVPASGQTVTVYADSSQNPWSFYQTATTDSNGNYTLTIQPPAGLLIDFKVYIYDCQQYMNQQTIQNNAANKTVNFSICIAVPKNCEAEFSFYNDQTNYKKIYFTDQSTGNIASRAWDFGDGTTSTVQNPNHIYQTSGYYTVCLKISDGQGCSDSFCDYVYVYPDSSGGCSTSYDYSINNLSVTFTAYYSDSSATVHYDWDFGDQTTGTGQNPTHTYASKSNYYVCLDAWSVDANNDTCYSSYCNYIYFNPPANGVIFGTLNGGNYTVDHAIVYLIYYNPADSSLTAIDTVNASDSSGMAFYYFANIPVGQYLVKAALTSASTDYAHLMPTYYGNKLFWHQASYALVTPQLSTYQANILMTYGTNPGGAGFIGGKTSQGANIWAGAGDPLSNIQVFLLDQSNNPITYQYSKTTGDFGFNSIAYGTYKIYAEIPGKNTLPAEATIDAAKPSVSNVKIIIGEKEITNSITDQLSPIVKSVGSVYPNPSNGNVQIAFTVMKNCSMNLQLVNSIGQVVWSSETMLTTGTNLRNINTSMLEKGIYNLRVSFSDGTQVNRQVLLAK